jgi:hypothetical protein
MFEAERVLMSDNVIIPLYTYVTKRLVSSQLRGWKNNVMDHHQTRHMFKLKWQNVQQAAPAGSAPEPADATPPAVMDEPEEPMETEAQDS